MSKKSGKLSLFWQELRRRKVIKAAAMYAATAFIIIDASANVLPRLGLPDWTVTFLIILLIVGFPITILLSWIFDITPKGVEKTESIEEDPANDETPKKSKRLLSLSNLIIAALLVLVCILLYPRLFNKDQLEDLRNEKGIISVAVMPFENLTGDSLFNTWQGGVQNLIISALSNSPELQVRQFMTMSNILEQKRTPTLVSLSPTQAREIALDLEARTFIQGKILKTGEKIRINAQLFNSASEEIYWTYQVDGSAEADLFSMSDSLGNLIRNYLEIQQLVEDFAAPQLTLSGNTQSAEAFRYYIRAYETFQKMDQESTIQWLMKAIETDPDFIEAYILLSFTYTSMLNQLEAEKWCDRAYEKRELVSLRGQLYLDHLHAYYYETPREEIRYCNQILEMDEMNTTYWMMKGNAFGKLEQYEEALVSYEKVLEIHEKWESPRRIPHIYYWAGMALHELGEHKRENEIYSLALEVIPNDALLRRFLAICAFSQGKEEVAENYIAEYRSLRERQGLEESRILFGIGEIYMEAGRSEQAVQHYQLGLSLDPESPFNNMGLAGILIRNDIDLERGIALAEQVLKGWPQHFGILHAYGLGLYKMERYEEAVEVLHRAWEVRGPYDPVLLRDIQAAEKTLAANTK